MKSFHCRWALSFLGLIIMLCCSCETAEQVAVAPAGKLEVAKPKSPAEPPAVEIAEPAADIIAEIGDYVVTKEEFSKRLVNKLRYGGGEYAVKVEPVDPETVLTELIAERAMVIDARRKNYLENERAQESLKDFKQRGLTSLLLREHLQEKVTVTDAEVDEKIKTNPKLNRARAYAAVGKEKSTQLINQLYSQICEKFHVKKISENFPKVAEIHQRLLLHPKKPHRAWWIRSSQVREELTPEEKKLALVSYDGGKVTLEDWFKVLCDFSPPSRPKGLDTVEGVERLVDMAMRAPLFTAEALSRGLQNNQDYQQQLRKREDLLLLGAALRKKTERIKQLQTEAEILDYFNKNKQEFRTPDRLRIDQIWCQDLETARKAKAELDKNPDDFESAKQEYSLEPDRKPFTAFPAEEGIFFEDLRNGEPNEIIGPVKGFYNNGVKWRIVKILEKKPGKQQEYSENLQGNIKDKAYQTQREAVLADYRKQLLDKYPYRIYRDRIPDPLDIP